MSMTPGILDSIRPYFDAIKATIAVVVVVGAFAIGWNRGADKWQGKYDGEVIAHKATKDGHKLVLDNLAALTKTAETKAKAATVAVKRDQAAADKRYQEALDDANTNAAALRAALRAGKQRLSDTWTCPASPGASDAAAGAEEARAARQYDSTARIVAAADADAAAMTWLWDSWMADRKAVIAAGCAVVAE